MGLIAHVGYDVEEIGPFLDALEAASRRLCVALLMERAPASAADPFWPPVHGEERVPLPALPDALELLTARGRNPTEMRISIEPRRFESREALERRFAELEEAHAGQEEVPRPPHWGGYLVAPTRVEFWQGRRNRLHDRLRYRRTDAGAWVVERLAP